MLIEDLKLKYPLVYERAIINQEKEENKSLYHGPSLDNGFEWSKSPEGHSFWTAIKHKRFLKARKMIPSLFTEIGTDFKKGDYVVLLHGCSKDIPDTWDYCMPIGGIYKLREDSNKNAFFLEKAMNGNPNSWSCEDYKNSRLLLRKATDAEIKYYNRFNIPFYSNTVYNHTTISKIIQKSNNLKLNKDEQISKNNEKKGLVKEQTGIRGQVIKSSSKKRPTAITSRLVGNRISIG